MRYFALFLKCSYCGWHTYNYVGNTPIKYSFVGNALTRCPSGCMKQVTGPHGSDGADGMVSVIAHELAEAVSDPLINGWFRSSDGKENADVSDELSAPVVKSD